MNEGHAIEIEEPHHVRISYAATLRNANLQHYVRVRGRSPSLCAWIFEECLLSATKDCHYWLKPYRFFSFSCAFCARWDGALPKGAAHPPKVSARKKKEIPLIHSRSSGRSAGVEMREGEKALTQMELGVDGTVSYSTWHK